MKKALKIALWSAGSTLICMGLAAVVLLANSHRKLNRHIELNVASVPSASGEAALTHGNYLYRSRCAECHGETGAGRTFADEPNGLFIAGANLTTGSGSAVSQYDERDWVRAIRHGVKPNGRPVFVMPSEDFNRLSDADLADLVAYVRALPPADGPGAVIRLPLLATLAHGAGVLKDAAEKIDHSLPPSQPVAEGVSVEHGHYVAQLCVGCHGAQFKGGRIAGAPPDWPPAATLVGPVNAFERYKDPNQFKTLVRTGVRPDGSHANGAMPRNSHLSDVDLEAMYLYFKSQPSTVARR